jgi:hypothetical protein
MGTPDGSVVLQESPSPAQQEASLVQVWPASEQACGGRHVPPVQLSSAEQQATVAEQLSPVAAQKPAAVQVPLVAPGATSQARPAQQSAATVQVPPWPWHGVRQVPDSQVPEQHWYPPAQPEPLGTQATQLPPAHRLLQQSDGPVQEVPLAPQLGGGSTMHW